MTRSRRVATLQVRQLRERVVRAAVVDREHLVGTAERAQHRGQLRVERLHVGDSLRSGITTEISGIMQIMS